MRHDIGPPGRFGPLSCESPSCPAELREEDVACEAQTTHARAGRQEAQANRPLSGGTPVPEVAKALEGSEQTYHRPGRVREP